MACWYHCPDMALHCSFYFGLGRVVTFNTAAYLLNHNILENITNPAYLIRCIEMQCNSTHYA